MTDTIDTINKATPEVETTNKETTIRISKRTGMPVRKYEHTGLAAKNRELRAQGISARTGKPVRKYVRKIMSVASVDSVENTSVNKSTKTVKKTSSMNIVSSTSEAEA